MDVFSWLGDAALLAHVLYGLPMVLPTGGTRVTLRNGDDFAASDAPPRPERLTGVRVMSSAGVVPLTPYADAAGNVHVDVPAAVSRPAWVVVESPPVFIELASDAFARYVAHEGLAHVIDARQATGTSGAVGREIYSKHVKTAVGSIDEAMLVSADAIGLPVELVPLSSEPLRAGADLEVELRREGRAVADVQVRVHHTAAPDHPPREAACARTDANGRIRLRLDAAGHWRCHAIVMTPHDHPAEADWRSHWACLTFRL